MGKRVDSSCKQRAECLCRSLVIIHTEHGQWQPSFVREKSAYLAEVSVTEQTLQKFPNSLSMHKLCVPGSLFFAHAREPGNKARGFTEKQALVAAKFGGV